MPQVKPGSTVLLHYTTQLKSGKVIDSSAGEDPVRITIGRGDLLPALENEVIGMSPGETKRVTLPAQLAYGRRSPELLIRLDKDQQKVGAKPETQERFTVHPGGNGEFSGAVREGRLTVDENPGLAGQDLVFTIDLVDILT